MTDRDHSDSDTDHDHDHDDIRGGPDELEGGEPWGVVCPDCDTAVPYSDPAMTDSEAVIEGWTCVDCGHSGTPFVALENPRADANEAVMDSILADFYETPCPACGTPVVAYGTSANLDGTTEECDACAATVKLESDTLSEAALGFDTVSKRDIHLWRTEDRSGVPAGLHVRYGGKTETKARIRDRHLENQQGHGPNGTLQPGRNYEGVEYLGTLAEHAEKTHDEPLVYRPNQPHIAAVFSDDGYRELRADLAEFVTGCVKVHCGECQRMYAYFGLINGLDIPKCGECGSAEILVKDERDADRSAATGE